MIDISIYIDMNNTLEFLKAIADDNRFKIITFLKDGEKCVCEIWQELDLPQNLISHHLKVLKDNEILFDLRVGQKIYYSLNNKEIIKQIKYLSKEMKEKMQIKILGSENCANCEKLLASTQQVVDKLKIEADVEKVTDIKEIVNYGIMSTPALVIDDKVIFNGRNADEKELTKILEGKINA